MTEEIIVFAGIRYRVIRDEVIETSPQDAKGRPLRFRATSVQPLGEVEPT